MKRLLYFFLIIFIVLLSFNLQAQDKNISFIYSGGFSLTPGSTSLSPYLGFSGRVGIEKQLSDHFSYEVGLMYSPLSLSLENLNVSENYHGNILSIPLFFKYRLFTASTPYLVAGPEVGYIFNLENSMEKMESFNHLYYGLTFGVGYELKISKKVSVAIEARKRLPLSNQ